MSRDGYMRIRTSQDDSELDQDTSVADSTNYGTTVRVPSDEGLRTVPDSIPLSVWLVTAIEMCDKFAFFGMAGPLQNYLQNSRDDPLRPGAVGLGQAYATAINQAFSLWCFLTPIFGAIVADQYLGRLNTILYASVVYLVGLFVVFATSFINNPTLCASGLFVSMFMIGIGTGGIRPNVNSLVAEQYTVKEESERVLESGETVIVDPKLTIQRTFLIFLFCVNLGSLSAIITTTLELRFGFPVAFALPTFVFAAGICVIWLTRHFYTVTHPQGSVIIHGLDVLWIASQNQWNFNSAKKSSLWDDDFVDEILQAVRACKLFMFFPIFWAAYSQMLTNFVSQAGTMETHGIPNDILIMLDPLAILAFIPILDQIVFPWLRRRGIVLSVVTRVIYGFALCSASMAYAASVQAAIYASPPCYSFPGAPDCFGGKVPNEVHVLVQIPGYILLALSEILIAFTGLEHAYNNAPQSMKSFVMSLFISTYAVGSLLAMAITPFTHDPNQVWIYAFLSLVALSSVLLLFRYRLVVNA